MSSFQLMMEAGNFLPPHVAPWATWMQVALFLLPVAFLKYWPARILLLSQVANTLLAYGAFVYEGNQVTRLFGIGHFAWAVPLVLLLRDWGRRPTPLYRGFIAVTSLTIAISLVFDVRDLVLWAGGDRASVLVGVPADHPLARATDEVRATSAR